MWKKKLGISLGNNYTVPTHEIVGLVKNIGFDAISPEWNETSDLSLIVNAAKDTGIELQSLHAPFDGAAAMWNEDKSVSQPALDKLLRSLEDCSKFCIPILVSHVWIGFNKAVVTNAGFENYEKLVNKAKEYNIKIAFENTEGENQLTAIMEHFKDTPNVGFCWDSGHEMCYNHSKDLLELYGDKLIMTHLNDNLGISHFDGETFWTDDLHLLPFDGVADWSYNADRLKKTNHIPEFLNFELNITSKPNRHENDLYSKMSYTEYFTEAYKRACRVAYKLY